jgi:hypothetical protein
MALRGPNEQSYAFFKQPGLECILGQRDETPAWVHMVGSGGFFIPVAVAMLDHFPTRPRCVAQWFSRLWQPHLQCFPQHRLNLPGLVTPIETLQALVRHVPMSELLPALAHTLRQLSVSEMCRHPAWYRGAFVHPSNKISPKEMRKPTTHLDESGLMALAKVLRVSIEILVVEGLKTLPLRRHYHHGEPAHPILVIQLQNDDYQPRVYHRGFFSSISLSSLSPAVAHEPDDALPEIAAEIDASVRQFIDVFEDTYDHLLAGVMARECSRDDLLRMYIKEMAAHDGTSCRMAGVEHGSQVLFEALYGTQGRIPLTTEDHDQHQIHGLVHALARLISIRQMSDHQHVNLSVNDFSPTRFM